MKETRKVREEFLKTRSWNMFVEAHIKREGSIVNGLIAHAKECEEELSFFWYLMREKNISAEEIHEASKRWRGKECRTDPAKTADTTA